MILRPSKFNSQANLINNFAKIETFYGNSFYKVINFQKTYIRVKTEEPKLEPFSKQTKVNTHIAFIHHSTSTSK